ncbi:jg11712 [Pararge aegeria aegeria]|uniref:RNA helicase n=1 Tax=Pararge aegeria aegeria TaxID=348720 RepID=A0A8S4S5D1_9NEOP|nr:jg11712 [Pararge aegeria aegeria]
MDAYDIFKKLTKGLKFKQRPLGTKNQQKQTIPSALRIEKDVKEEKLIQYNIDSQNNSGSDNENDDIILGSGNENDTNDSVSENEYDEKKADSENGHNCALGTKLEGSLEEDCELQLVAGVTVEKKMKNKSKLDPVELKKKLELEEQNHFRNLHGIKAIGRHIPKALEDFTDVVTRYKVAQTLIDTVVQCGYSEPTPIQRQAIPCLLEGRQIVACAPTGSGKTAAFLVPLLHLLGAPSGGPRALVLCPTRELAHQIYREALRLSASTQLRCTVIKSVKESKIKERENTIRKSGRAGRAGQTGRAITFFTQDDVVNLRSIASVMKQSGCEVPQYMLTLKQNASRRKNLLKKAPHRDQISTRLEKPEKRKLDEKTDKNDTGKSKDTVAIKNSKSNKQRKVDTGESKTQRGVKEKRVKEKDSKKGVKKTNKLGKTKRKKKNFSKAAVKK